MVFGLGGGLTAAGVAGKAPAGAGACCPHCGSGNTAGNEVAGVCLDCGQAVILGFRLPVVALLGGGLLAAGAFAAGRLVAGRRGYERPAPGRAVPALRVALGVLLALAVCAGSVHAAETEATVVSYDKDTMKLVVKVVDKERTIQLQKNTHVHYPDGGKIKEVRLKERPDYLKKGVRIVITEENGKLIEINIRR
jgi:hypothetical protein